MASRTALAVVLLLLLLSVLSVARYDAPKLLVVLVVDQMRADYADLYGYQWTAGLRRLFDDGAWFRRASYPYSATVTCAGHATIVTGSFPAKHGIIQNSWWDRASDQRVSCTTDHSAEPISYGGQAREQHSPHTLAIPTLADVLRLKSSHRPRVVSLAIKPRSQPSYWPARRQTASSGSMLREPGQRPRHMPTALCLPFSNTSTLTPSARI